MEMTTSWWFNDRFVEVDWCGFFIIIILFWTISILKLWRMCKTPMGIDNDPSNFILEDLVNAFSSVIQRGFDGFH